MQDIYLIKDLSKLSGFSIYTLKYYLKIGLIQEAGRFPETNFRFFDKRTLSNLERIRQLRRKRTPIKEIKLVMKKTPEFV